MIYKWSKTKGGVLDSGNLFVPIDGVPLEGIDTLMFNGRTGSKCVDGQTTTLLTFEVALLITFLAPYMRIDAPPVRITMRARIARWKRHWSTFEWYGIAFYWRHMFLETIEVYMADLRPLRALLSIPSFGVGFWLIVADEPFDNPGFGLIAPWIGEDALGAIFVLHGIGMLWRMYALSRIIGWSMVYGAMGMTLYLAYPIFVWMDLHRFTGAGIAMAGWAWASTWITARLGRGEDRAGP